MTRPDVVVVGAGIIGLVSAFELLRAQRSVVLLDPALASGATFAAAGMLAPGAEFVPGEDENFSLQRSSVARWRTLSQALFEVTGTGVPVYDVGTLLVGWDHGDRQTVRQTHEVSTAAGVEMSVVRRDEQPSYFEHLNERLTTGLFYPGEAWIDPDEAVRVLRAGIEQLGGDIRSVTAEELVEVDGGVRVVTSGGDLEASCALVATGAHPPLAGMAVHNTVRPIRGVTVRCDGVDRFGLPMVRAVVRGRPFYMVGRAEGHCVLGATAQEASGGAIEIGELRRLLADALDVLPSLEVAAWTGTRVGHRPVSPSGVPFFEHEDGKRWAWSSGHYRHGVTLAPLASQWAVQFAQEVLS